jgi:hypothetical protein
MSILDVPRIYLRGEVTWDPMVTNNFAQLYDSASGQAVLGGLSAAEYREQVRQTVSAGNWNPHGTHRARFVNVAVTGVDRGDGRTDDDLLVGAPVALTGMLVDVDPYGASSSQLFFDDLSCGIEGSSRIHGRRIGPFASRRINFNRNTGYQVIAGRASVVWQTSFSWSEGLSVEPRGSAVLQELSELLAGGAGRGLTVRLNTYRTAYYGRPDPQPADDAELARRLSEGGFHPNPARGVVVGVIGLWGQGEPAFAPGDRVLAPIGNSPLSTAFAQAGEGRLVLDLANSVPETDYQLNKLDLGALTVMARRQGGSSVLATLAPSVYDKAAYESTSGIVVLPLAQAQAAEAQDAELALVAADGTALLAEQPLTCVADKPNVYLEEGETIRVELRVLEGAAGPASPVSISVVDRTSPGPPAVVQADAEGVASLELSGGQAGFWTYFLQPWRDVQPAFDAARILERMDYLTLRVSAADSDIAALEPTWENVYLNVLRNFEALAPCMDNWLRLGDEEQCRAYAPLIRSLTSRQRFDDYRYMPVTRELSKGRRTLLHRWCDAVEHGPVPAVRQAEGPAPRPRDPFGRGF